MKRASRRVSWMVSVPLLVAFAYACGGSSEDGSGPGGSGSGTGGSSASTGGSSSGAAAAAGDGGSSSGAGGSGNNGGTTGVSGGTSAPVPEFPGAGSTSGAPLRPGCGPDTASLCGGECNANGTGTSTTVVTESRTDCFYDKAEGSAEIPGATIEQIIEVIDGVEMIHMRITFDPRFVDTTYGDGSVGWGKRGHRFRDLTGSDHTELQLYDTNGELTMHFKIDFISDNPDSPCGYGTLGVTGGDGKVLVGSADDVIAVSTSLDRNLNNCGESYCMTEHSPPTDDNFSVNPDFPEWDYRMVYEIWVRADAFGDAGFSHANISYVHASPAKQDNDTIEVEPRPCPPDWDTPYGGTGGGGSGGGGSGTCPPDWEVYKQSEGAVVCTPIPGDNPDGGQSCPPDYTIYLQTEGESYCVPVPTPDGGGGLTCPEGFTVDLASEGQYCI